MNRYVVVSLYTDGGPNREMYNKLRETLTGSATNPQYVLRDPFDDKVLDVFDYNQVKASTFAGAVERGARRCSRAQLRRSGAEASR